MTQLKDALQFVVLTLIARLIGYLVVRAIELFKPRSIHFIIAAPETVSDNPVARNKTSHFTDPIKSGRKHSAKKGEKTFFAARIWEKALRLKAMIRFIAAGKRRRDQREKVSVKLLSEIVGLLTALVSLAIILANYFLR